MTALSHALIHLGRLRWLGAAFCALAIMSVTTHAVASTHASSRMRATATASATKPVRPKTRVGDFEQSVSLASGNFRLQVLECPQEIRLRLGKSCRLLLFAQGVVAVATSQGGATSGRGVPLGQEGGQGDPKQDPYVAQMTPMERFVLTLPLQMCLSTAGINLVKTGWQFVFAEGGSLASSAINAPRLANQLVYEEAASAFAETGTLSRGALEGAKQIFQPGALGNPAIPEGFAKYTTQTFASPSGPFQVHFYMNPESGAVFYGLDYKVIFNLGIQPFIPFSGIVP